MGSGVARRRVIQMTDDEKFLFRGNSIEDLERMTDRVVPVYGWVWMGL